MYCYLVSSVKLLNKSLKCFPIITFFILSKDLFPSSPCYSRTQLTGMFSEVIGKVNWPETVQAGERSDCPLLKP